MSLRLLKPNEGARNMGCIVWVEDLERAGESYGSLLGWLADCGMPCVASPVHDRDEYTPEDVRGWVKRHIDPDTGEVAAAAIGRVPVVGGSKKPHIHVYFAHKGNRTPLYMSERLDEFIPGLIASNRWVKVEDWGAAVRYCSHKDAPNKAQYSDFDIHGFSNADMSALNDSKNVDTLQLDLEIEDAIEREDIRDYWSLNRWANATADRDLINRVKGRTSHWAPLLAARNAKRKAREAHEAAQREAAKMEEMLRNFEDHKEVLLG